MLFLNISTCRMQELSPRLHLDMRRGCKISSPAYGGKTMAQLPPCSLGRKAKREISREVAGSGRCASERGLIYMSWMLHQ